MQGAAPQLPYAEVHVIEDDATVRSEMRPFRLGAGMFGVFGALLAYLTAQRGSVPPEVINRLRISTSIFVVYSLFYGFAQAGIDNAAHVGGLAGGFLMGLIGARPLDRSRPGACFFLTVSVKGGRRPRAWVFLRSCALARARALS